MKTTIIILIVLGVLLVSGFSYAKYRGFCTGPVGKADWLTYRISKQLELDDEQQQQLDRLREKALELMQSARQDGPQGIDQALQLLDAPQLDRERAYQIWDTKHSWIAAAGPQMIDAFANFSDSLNEDQRGKLQSMIKHHREHRHSRYCCDSTSPVVQE
jgi:hypothetical protein